ncbi:ACP S-malonyltransferase [Bacillus paralicheniformis]|uniref:ACP S-malonyltransferase n=1 Tax=Bacillus paralicheniformis TaxID=1648923 RepID=UPI001F1BB843|nr:ACP S-malonyltransferase [Bacillus paralicheniformis]
MTTYVFPGQGSQYKGMGETLFKEFPDLTALADEILGYSIKDLCLYDNQSRLSQTQYTQPALYTVNALSFLKIVEETGDWPDYVAGHSLGEFNALFAAGVFDFETGLRLVKKRGELMTQSTGGGMAAIIGLSLEQVCRILQEHELTGLDVANENAPSQTIVSGRSDDIIKAGSVFEQAGAAMFVPLNVSGAFHSRYMEEASDEFSVFLDKFEFSRPTIPVIANVSARPYEFREIKSNLIRQIVSGVKWTDTIRLLMGIGETNIEEVGPGNVLTKLIHTIQREAEPLSNAQDLITLDEEIAINENVEPEKPVSNPEVCRGITMESLGDEGFKRDYNVKYAYVTGAMYRGIASKDIVIRMGKSGMLGYFGTGGLKLDEIEQAIQDIQRELRNTEAYGMNLLYNPANPLKEEKLVDMFLKYKVRNVEASAYMSIVPSLIRYRAKGLKRDTEGNIIAQNKIIAKLSRPEVAQAFLSPAPERLVKKMVKEGDITNEEADMLQQLPMADDICVEADSGGHTDQGVAYTLMPAMLKLRNEYMEKYGYRKKIRIGAAGGIGTPEAAAAAFMLGAEFIVTGSINQCTVEAGTSDTVKDLLMHANVQDTEYAPAGDMFEMGARVQVLKKGLFFPTRANRLYELYRQNNSIDEIDEKTKNMIQNKYFHRDFEEVYQEIKNYHPAEEIVKAEQNPKHKMALIFKWYFGRSTFLAMSGSDTYQVDYQIHCGPALGAFNQWVKGTPLEDWRNRHVDDIAFRILEATVSLLNERFKVLANISDDSHGVA